MIPAMSMIQHVTRVVSPASLDACVSFYGLIGFAPAAAPPGVAGRAVWLALGDTQLHLMPDPQARPEAGHIAVVAADYDATVARLGAAGHTVEPRREHWGAPRSYVRDPAGNLVELMERPPSGRPPSSRPPSSDPDTI
jgi:catechol 2,3-dioxygenase-like lactoylglutathione lyase family enzyme